MSAPAAVEVAVSAHRSLPYLALAKPRLNLLVLLTTLAGFYMGSTGAMETPILAWLMIGTALAAAGASALNQWMEREGDGRMHRTQDRPVPSGRVQPHEALAFGVILSLLGTVILGLAVNLLTAGLAAVTCLGYLAVYTPLKKITVLNTLVGAVPGAIPPVMGWTAARGSLDVEAGVLFGILFLWQIPHFLAIAWLYREDYERAGMRMLPLVEHGPRHTGLAASLHAAALLAVAALPTWLGLTGATYLRTSLVLGAAYLLFSVHLVVRCEDGTARRLFRVSLLYLPILFIVMALDKVAGGTS